MLIATATQKSDAAFLVRNRRACLFSEPGTGKTLTAITALKALPRDLRTLVICPKIALRQWQRELSAQGIKSTILRRRAQFTKIAKADRVVITTWRLMTDHVDVLAVWQPAVCIADESHATIDFQSGRTQAFYGWFDSKTRKPIPGVIDDIPFVWLMTGTPVIRYANDLWPMLNKIWPNKLTDLVGARTHKAFKEKFVMTRRQRVPGGRWVDVDCGGMNEELLNAALYKDAPIAVRRTLKEVDSELPQERYRDIEIDVTDFDESMLAGLTDGDLMKDTPQVKSIRRAFGISKVRAAVDYLATINEPTLVLTWHQDTADLIAQAFHDRAVVIDGRTSEARRAGALATFEQAKARYLIGNISAVGTALDGLQRSCKRVVFVERIGSPSLMAQAIARAVRRGQTESVLIETMRADHRLEDVTDATLEAKSASHGRINE